MKIDSINIPIKVCKRVECKNCNNIVSPSIFVNFYECKECKSITNNVNIIVYDTIGGVLIKCV